MFFSQTSFLHVTKDRVELLLTFLVQVDHCTAEVWHWNSQHDEVEESQIEIKIESVWHDGRSVVTVLDNWNSSKYKAKRDQVLRDVEEVEWGHAEPIDPVVLKF